MNRIVSVIVLLSFILVSSTSFADDKKPAGVISLEKIVVTPSRSPLAIGDIPTDVSVIDSETIKDEQPLTMDETLRFIPGVDVSRRTGFTSATSNVTLRGFGTQSRGRTLVMIDGVPFNEAYSGEVFWNAINPYDVENMEVVPGVSTMYGPGAMGGVINVITKEPKKFAFETDLSYGSYATRSFYVSQALKYKNLSCFVSGNGFKTNGYVAVPDRQSYDIRRWRESFGSMVKLRYDIDDTMSVGAKYQYYDQYVNGGRKYYYGTIDLNNLNFDIKKNFGDVLEITQNTYFNWENNWWAYDSPSTGAMANRYSRIDYQNNNPKFTWGGNLQGLITYPDINKFWAGMDWSWGKINSKDQYVVTRARTETEGKQKKIGFYIQDEVTILNKLIVYAGGRMDYWKNYDGYMFDSTQRPVERSYDPGQGDIAFSPTAGAVFHITDDMSIRGKAGKAFRIPTLYDLYRTWRSSTTTYASNPGLRPEQTYSYEVGIDNTFKEKLLTRATFYFNDVTDMIYSLAAVRGISAKDNIGRVAIYGMEIENRYALNDNFSVFCNYTWNRSRIIKQINQTLDDKDLAYTPRNKISYGTSLKIPKMFDFNFTGWYNGRMFNDEQNANKLKEIFVFDLTASKKLTNFFEVSIKIENLFDRRYQEYSGVLAPPRTATVTGKVAF